MPSRKDAPADPDKLTRETAGSYRTADGRFEIQQNSGNWFLLDEQQTDELGQPLVQGPFSSLKAARESIAGARKTKPMARGRRRPPTRPARPDKPEPKRTRPEPPPSWIDRLPAAEASRVRRLIGALEGEGVAGDVAEAVIRADREGLVPAVAARLIEHRLTALVAELPDDARDAGRALVARVAELLAAEGTRNRAPLPRWVLIEIGDEGEPPNRRITL